MFKKFIFKRNYKKFYQFIKQVQENKKIIVFYTFEEKLCKLILVIKNKMYVFNKEKDGIFEKHLITLEKNWDELEKTKENILAIQGNASLIEPQNIINYLSVHINSYLPYYLKVENIREIYEVVLNEKDFFLENYQNPLIVYNENNKWID